MEHNTPLNRALGTVAGLSNQTFTGVGINLQAGVDTDLICNGSPPVYPYPSDTGEGMRLVGAEVADTTQLIRLRLLDIDYLEVIKFIDLEGTTPVIVPDGPYVRCNGMRVVGDTAVTGDVFLQDVSGAKNFACIDVDSQRAFQGTYTIPADKKAIVEYVIGAMQKSMGTDTDVTLSILKRSFGSVFSREFGFGLQRSGDTSIEFKEESPAMLLPKTDLKILATTNSAGTDVLSRVGLTLINLT